MMKKINLNSLRIDIFNSAKKHIVLNGWNNKSPSWNFYKYLFDRSGNLAESWSSMTKPDSKKITNKIVKRRNINSRIPKYVFHHHQT